MKINKHIKATKKHLEKRAREFVRKSLDSRAAFIEHGIGGTKGVPDVWACIGHDGLSCWLELKASSHWEWRAKQIRFAINCDLHGFPYFLLFNDIGGNLKWDSDESLKPKEEKEKSSLLCPFVLIKPYWEGDGIERYRQPVRFAFLARMSKHDNLHEILKREIS